MKFFYFLILIIGQTSAQIIWTKHATPVLNRSAIFPNWKGLATGDACVLKDNDTLKMWYSGSGWLTASDDCSHVRLGYAWSLDGINWNEYLGNPVLDINSDTSKFDADGIETPTVIKDLNAPVNERYKLWYAGRKARCLPVNDHKFGYAYSSNGINWTKYSGNPILVPGNNSDWYNTFISSPSVILENGIYKMWFTAPDLVINSQPTDGKGNIGYATSVNGTSWTVHPSPVLIAGDQNNWDSASIAEPSVIKINGGYHMFYSALDKWTIENFQVGYATSSDGLNWTKSMQNPVLKIGSSSQWDDYWASHPGVIYDQLSSKFKMWYTGRDTATITSLNGYHWDIGYAESSFTAATISESFITNHLFMYPNPTQDNIYFEEEINVSIYGMSGELIYSGTTQTINVSQWPNGIYFVKNGANSFKFIVSH